MKILWFANSPCGSIRKHKGQALSGGWLISLEDEFKKHHEINLHVAYFSETENESFEFEGVTYHPLYCPKSKNPLIRILDRGKSISKNDDKWLPMMLKVVEDVKPDLIHIHGTEERFGLIQELVKDIPIVFSIQGIVSPYKEKYFSGFSKDFIKKHEGLFEKLRGFSELKFYKDFEIRVQREKKYLQKARYIIGRTFWDKTVTGLFNSQRLYFVGDEILRSDFYQFVWNKERWNESLTLVSTISPGPYKGIETLLKTAFILKQNAKIPFSWKVIGLSKADKWLNMAVKLTGIKPSSCNVELCGRLNSEQMAPLMKDCDIYCHVSHIENSPNSVCEAMLLGMPVIATFAGGTPSMLEHMNEGMLVQDGEPYSLAATIYWLYGNFSEAQTMGKNARMRASVRHNAQRIGNELIKNYSNIIEDFNK